MQIQLVFRADRNLETRKEQVIYIFAVFVRMFGNAFKKLLRKGKQVFPFILVVLVVLALLMKIELEVDQANIVFKSIGKWKPASDRRLASDNLALTATTSARNFPLIYRTRLLTFTSCPSSVFVLILVSTNVLNFDRRALIRRTWGIDNAVIPRWKTVFLLGNNNNDTDMKKVSHEADIYEDMVQADYTENFWNMTYKVAMGFEWAAKHCKFDYMLKSDDDVFVSSYRLLDFLTSPNIPKSKLFTGNIMINSPVLRKGRYRVPYDQYNETVFKPYCSGGGIVFSRDVVVSFAALFDVERPFHIDDAYLGILAEKTGVKPVHNPDFKMYENRCNYRPQIIVQHPAKSPCLETLFSKMQEDLFGRI